MFILFPYIRAREIALTADQRAMSTMTKLMVLHSTLENALTKVSRKLYSPKSFRLPSSGYLYY